MDQQRRRRRKPDEEETELKNTHDLKVTIKRKKRAVDEEPETKHVPITAATRKKRIKSRPTGRVGDVKRKVEKSTRRKGESRKLPKKITEILNKSFFFDLLQIMDEGMSFTIIKRKHNKWTMVSDSNIVIQKNERIQLKGKAYWDLVLSQEYQANKEEWELLSGEEKIKKALAAGAEWEEHIAPRINVMRCADAYRRKLNITKYKEEYSTLASRKVLRMK